MIGEEPWSELDRALRPFGFTGYRLSDLGRQNLATLEATAISVENRFVRVAENPEWSVITSRLFELRRNAQYIALKPENEYLDIVIGKMSKGVISPAQGYVDAEKDYIKFIYALLKDMHGASKAFTLSKPAQQLVTQASNLGDPFLVGDPYLDLAVAAARLVLPFIKFRGTLRCVVVVAATQVDKKLSQQWESGGMWALPSQWEMKRAGVRGWLWDYTNHKVYGSPAPLIWRGSMNLFEIGSVRSTSVLERNLRNT